jgi:adenosylmethionine-8-amino-7-oxononanoate aminotransferase
VRGTGYFWSIELVRNQETKETITGDEEEWLLRGDPVIQLSPPLIAGPEQFEEIRSVLRPVLEEASERLHCGQ